MSFEAFEVHLHPLPVSCLYADNTLIELNALMCDIQAQWPNFRPDEVEIGRLFEPLQANETLYVHETTKGLIQLSAQLDTAKGSLILVLRFAYCNPRNVQELFCSIVSWLMQRYQLYCHVAADLAPEHRNESDNIYSLRQVNSLLIPSMDYNKRLWQLNTGTSEEAILRPGDAVARFVAPLFVNS